MAERRLRPLSVRRPACLAAALVVVAGCASAPDETAAPQEVDGTYASDDATSDIVRVTFAPDDATYALWRRACPADVPNPCFESGRYAWNAAHDSLELTSDEGVRTPLAARTEAFSPPPLSAGGSLTTQSLVGETKTLLRQTWAGRLVVGTRELVRDAYTRLTADTDLEGKSVLLLPLQYRWSSDTNAFLDGALELRTWYRSKGATAYVVRLGLDPQTILDRLGELAAGGKKYDRIILLAHGGRDGPLWAQTWEQIGLNWPNAPPGGPRPEPTGGFTYNDQPNPPEETIRSNRPALDQLLGLLKSISVPGGFVYVGSCHSGGDVSKSSDVRSNLDPRRSFIELTACATGETAYGTSVTTSGQDVVDRVRGLETNVLVNPNLERADPSPTLCGQP
jgi:hypothetical protein